MMDAIVKSAGIDWDAEILDMWAKPIPIEPGSGRVMTLRFCIVEALGAAYPGEENLTGDERVKRWSLALRIRDEAPALRAEDVVLIKRLVNKRWPQPFVIGQIFELVDPGER